MKRIALDTIDQDIVDRIDKDFTASDATIVKSILTEIYRKPVDYHTPAQISRSIVFLAHGDVDKIEKQLLRVLKADPRDIVAWAEFEAQGPGHDFRIPFPEIDVFFEKLYANEAEEPAAEIFWVH